jgi:hypothetical protein
LKAIFKRIPIPCLELVPKLSFKRIQMPFQNPRQADLDIRPIRSSLIYDKFSRHCLQAGESHHIMKIGRFSGVFAQSDRPRPQLMGAPSFAFFLAKGGKAQTPARHEKVAVIAGPGLSRTQAARASRGPPTLEQSS